MKAFFVAAVLLIATNASAWSLFGPANQEECLVDKLKGTSETDTVARQQIFKYCYEKFKGSEASAGRKCVTRELTRTERESLQYSGYKAGRTGSKPYFTTDVYNGNKQIEITAISVEISSPNFTAPQEYDLYFSTTISPNAAGNGFATIALEPVAGWSVKVTSVKTCD